MNNLIKSITGKYNAGDVDKLLQKVRDDYELCLKNQKERILRLRDENRELNVSLELYRSNERYISGAITRAQETAQIILQQAQIQARKQIEMAEREAKQIRIVTEGCYRRLMVLKSSSESIYKAVTQVLDGCSEPETDNLRHFAARRDSTHV